MFWEYARETVCCSRATGRAFVSARCALKSAFSKYRGIGNPGIGSGRKSIGRWLWELRGQWQLRLTPMLSLHCETRTLTSARLHKPLSRQRSTG